MSRLVAHEFEKHNDKIQVWQLPSKCDIYLDDCERAALHMYHAIHTDLAAQYRY